MAAIPPQWLSAVVALGVPDLPDPRWIATGFLYLRAESRATDGSTVTGKAYLVTNRHVVQGQDALLVRVNPTTDTEAAQAFPLELKRQDGSELWHGHPDIDVDVVVVPINAQVMRDAGMEVQFFMSDRGVLRRTEMAEEGVFEGDDVFILGFPLAMVGGDRNVAIVRGGSIARVSDLLAGGRNDFLVDAQVFPGNSGGPVILKPTAISIEGTKAIGRACLVGIVRSYVPYSDVAVSQQTGQVRVVFQENTGLASVHPVDCIEEAIDQHLARIPFTVDPAEEVDEIPTGGW